MVLNRPIDSEITQVLDLVLIGHLVLCSACDEALEIGKHQGLEGGRKAVCDRLQAMLQWTYRRYV
jgi:hypothetical protein